jgi:UDP-N-acetylglucosamine 3-dehydrogenase
MQANMALGMRIGVAGVGFQGQRHVKTLSELGALEMVYDTDETKLESVAKSYRVKSTNDYANLLSNVDAVVIATPATVHYNMAVDAIKAEKHLLIEKPICNTVEEAYTIRDALPDANLVCAVGYVERHNPAVRFSKDALTRGDYGKLITLSAKRVSPNPVRILDVGVILDLAVHDIDIARYIAASEASGVYTYAGSSTDSGKEDHALITIDFENGINALVEVHWLSPVRLRKLTMTCERSVVEVDYMNQTVQEFVAKFKELEEEQEYGTRLVSLVKRELLKNELSDFIQAVKNNGKPLVTLEDGIRVLEIVGAALESNRLKKRVEVRKR